MSTERSELEKKYAALFGATVLPLPAFALRVFAIDAIPQQVAP